MATSDCTGVVCEEDDVLLDGVCDSLESLGYTGPLLDDDNALSAAVQSGLSSPHYKHTLTTVCSSLQRLCSLECSVSIPQSSSEDIEAFQLELRSFLRELCCPHSVLLQGVDVLATYHCRLLLLDYLLSELMAARLTSGKREEEMDTGQEGGGVEGSLSAILRAYDIKQPPPDITVKQIFDKIIGTTREAVSKVPCGPSLVIQSLSPDHWVTLDKINASLSDEYEVRRKMLLTRCDVTVQSFRWSDKIKDKEEEFTRVYQTHRQRLKSSAPVGVARVLATKSDILTVEKTNNDAVRANTVTSVNKVLIGSVPDRGGRPMETRPPPEMPAFKARTTAPPQDQRGGGGGRGHNKGRVQGSWSQGKRGGRGGGGWQQGKGHHGNHQQTRGGGRQK